MMFDGAFGSAGAEVVIEEFLEGREISFFALCDGETAIPLATAQDHKRVFDHDEGPNTGGMGAYSPTPFVTPEIHDQIMARIILPTVEGMKARGTPFRGVLYAGVMLTEQGPKLFEYNVRFGDPECQVLMLRMMSDIVPAFLAACDGQLRNFDLRWFPDPALTVVMAAKGYPGDYEKGTRIEGLDDAAQIEGVEIFHAGTVAKDGAILANGGRVLNVCAMGKTVLEAQQRAYQAVDRINWPEGFAAATSPGRRWSRRRRTADAESANGITPATANASCPTSFAADGLPSPRCRQSMLPTAFVISAAEKARSDSVRTLPSAARLNVSDMKDNSSGASRMVTMSYRPCVQTISLTVTPNVFAIALKASARFGDSLALRIPCSVKFASTT